MSAITEAKFSPLPRNPLGQDVAVQLIIAICQQQLRGGDRLVEAELAERFNVSRTPIREALIELETAGLVEDRMSRGVVVREFGPQQLLDIYQVRGTLEGEATRSAAGRMEAAELKNLKKQMQDLQTQSRSGKSPDWGVSAWEADERLHGAIAQHCGNSRLIEEISRYKKLVSAVRKAVNNPNGQQEVAIGEHLQILDCLLTNDAEGANRAMRFHIESAAKVAVEAMFPEKPAFS